MNEVMQNTKPMAAEIAQAITEIEKLAPDVSWSFGTNPVVDIGCIGFSAFVQISQPAREAHQGPIMVIQRHETFAVAAGLPFIGFRWNKVDGQGVS